MHNLLSLNVVHFVSLHLCDAASNIHCCIDFVGFAPGRSLRQAQGFFMFRPTAKSSYPFLLKVASIPRSWPVSESLIHLKTNS